MRPNEVENPPIIDLGEALDQQRRAINVEATLKSRRNKKVGVDGNEGANERKPECSRNTMGLSQYQYNRVKYFLTAEKPAETISKLAEDLDVSEDTALNCINDERIQGAILKHLNNWFWTVEIKAVAQALLKDVRKGDTESIKLWIQIFGKPNDQTKPRKGIIPGGLPEDEDGVYIPEESDAIDYGERTDEQLEVIMRSGGSADADALKQVKAELKK